MTHAVEILRQMERQEVHRLHVYREIAHEEQRRRGNAHFWYGLAQSAVRSIRFLREAI